MIDIVRDTPLALALIEDQTEAICRVAVSVNGFAIVFVKHQTWVICMTAIKNNPHTIQFVIDQTRDLCFQAIKDDWRTLKHIKNQTYEICKSALRGRMFIESHEIVRMIRDKAMRNHVAHMYDQHRSIKISPLLARLDDEIDR